MRKLLLLPILLAFACTAALGQANAENRPVDVPDINGMAVSLVKPAFPETAVAADADGKAVIVRVVVDENGSPVSAACSLDCHPMLKDAAELAALQSKFKPLIRDGRAVRYQGTLHFTFVVKRVDWMRFGTALESVRQFDNLSMGPVAQILPAEFAKEKAQLTSLDADSVTFETRQSVIRDVEASVKTTLTGMELWRFNLGMALRRVTFWPQAGGPVVRPELQKALENLAAVTAAAPEGVPADLMTELTALSKYQIPAEIPERDLRDAIMKFSQRLTLVLLGRPVKLAEGRSN